MILTSTYILENKTDKTWYNSSNVFYSEFIENEAENIGDLFVTFNNGATYKYKGVLMTPDYVMFKHGGLEGSHGKALNKHIKPKYEFEKVESKDIVALSEERNEVEQRQKMEILNKTYFISGHRDTNEDDFNKYKEKLNEILETTPDALFVVGDYHGVDIMAQNYLMDELNLNPSQITVYHMFDSPRNINSKITQTIGGFTSDEERDSAMTNASSKDVAFIKTHMKLSGTAQNILRRFVM